MQYKKLYKRTVEILRHPRKEWDSIKTNETDNNTVINDFVLPMVGLCAVSAFLGILFQGINFEKALVSVIISLGKLLGGVYFSFFVLQESAIYFGLQRNKKNFMQMAGYGFVVVFVVDIVVNLIPELFFLPILELYTFYLMGEAIDVFTQIDEKKRTSYIIFSSLVIIASPHIIEFILNKVLMPGAKIVAS